MRSSQIRSDSIEKSEKVSRKIPWAIIFILLTLSIPVALFSFDEWQRTRLLRNYSKVAVATNLPSQSGVWNTTLILQPNEVMACVLGSYGSAESLLELNEQQRKSLPKAKLPSQDGSWYLLIFSEHQVERVALYPDTTSSLVFADDSCGGLASQFSISPRPMGVAGHELVISFLPK